MEREKVLEMFNAKFGTSVDLRLVKLREEFGELMEAADKDIFGNKENLEDFIDELADLNAVLYHIAGILGFTQEQLLEMAVEKIVGREKDPNYKRKHPHVENKNQ
jgi:NTP pyrophosphatase (non-canonical NTP hydrolase)